jgi:hypothetical protein
MTAMSPASPTIGGEYGGGMGELGIGRGQIELLAALFHADAPNDVAPSAYNDGVLARQRGPTATSKRIPSSSRK